MSTEASVFLPLSSSSTSCRDRNGAGAHEEGREQQLFPFLLQLRCTAAAQALFSMPVSALRSPDMARLCRDHNNKHRLLLS